MNTILYKPNKNEYWGYFIALVHVSGAIGMLSSYREIFINLTALNLLFSFALVVWFHKNKNKSFWKYTSVIVLGGFLIELIGVNTAWPFGEYYYGVPFGPQIFDTPPLIGLNWFVFTYCGALLCKKLHTNPWVRAIASGILITAIDLVLEPVAIHSGYWTWIEESVPIQNYVSWFICITLFTRIIYYYEDKGDGLKNKIALWVIGAQLVFLITLMLYYVISK